MYQIHQLNMILPHTPASSMLLLLLFFGNPWIWMNHLLAAINKTKTSGIELSYHYLQIKICSWKHRKKEKHHYTPKRALVRYNKHMKYLTLSPNCLSITLWNSCCVFFNLYINLNSPQRESTKILSSLSQVSLWVK